MSLAIAMDYGGTRLKAALMDEQGNRLQEIHEPSFARENYEQIFRHIAATVKQFEAQTEQTITGVGIGVAGLMGNGCHEIAYSPNCPALTGKQLASDVADLIDLPVKMDNDANLMAVGEGWLGAARGMAHYIAVTLGTGVGGAIINDGKLMRGVDGGGCEIGHIPIARQGPRCGCGAYGCLETFIGTAGMRRFISRRQPRFKGMSMKEVNRIALEGDPGAADVFRFVGRHLGIALAGMVNLFNPEGIIIGGGVSAAGDLLFDSVYEELNKRAFDVYLQSVTIKEAELGTWAGVAGAAKLVFD